MSSASRSSWMPNRRLNSNRQSTRPRGYSRGNIVVSHDDAYTFALRVAYLNYLLQPRQKRKQYVAAPKPAQRSHTSVTELVGQFVSGGSGSVKLPHGFQKPLEKRIKNVLTGKEPMQGFNDAALKRSFAEAYTAFTERNFQKSVEKDRKLEPYVLMFYSSATKANQKYAQLTSATDDSWKEAADRHMAMFIRLVAQTLRDQGHDRDRPELMSRLHTLENKLLTRDQNLSIDASQDGGSTIEVVVPLSYDVKDMPLVLTVARMFGRSNSEVQSDIDANRHVWTEESALKDVKAYQQRLASDAPGALRSEDFDLEDAFQEWKRAEAPHLSQIILDILTVKPELAKTSSGTDKPLPGRPMSMFGNEQAYSEISKAISSPDGSILNFDSSLGIGSLSFEESGSDFEAAVYTFIPADARAFYKAILQVCMTYDQLHADPVAEYSPLSKSSTDLLIELCVYWRIPQFSRLIAFVEVAARKFLDREIGADDLFIAFQEAKSSTPEVKKAPHLHQYNFGLADIDQSRWTMHDFAVYQQTLHGLYDALLRDLYDLMVRCYEGKPPSIASVMTLLEEHILQDPSFSARPEQAQEFASHLTEGLRRAATEAYNAFVREKLPDQAIEWEFHHVVQLGQAVTKLSDKIRKRYRNIPDIMGVQPWPILVETMFPSFERDAQHIIERTIAVAKERGEEINVQDGFNLYKELVGLRQTHHAALPDKPFEFQIEELLAEFVWRWVRNAETMMVDIVINAIKQDTFQVNPENEEELPTDAERHSFSIIELFRFFRSNTDMLDQLQWDSDVHYAKFNTALARSFAAGIGLYCEEVEKRFAKEMDRPTAEEAAAANKTTQEKFMQYARDAWNTKDAPEPFQFLSESFVKLNNIEYAMQELDKLEKLMNVDGCAEVLRRAEGNKQQQRRPNKYVFTIKVVEAEELKACDPSGFSDPYVVLGDEYQKRLYKTRIVYRNLNPRWDESVDITVSGPLNVIATIWDYDTFGDHDFVGRTSLKLDPIHFSDYLPREYWLDLDTQGRLLLRVSMEGERDDIQFYFGKAFRHLKRTERDMVRKITDKDSLAKTSKLRAEISTRISIETLRSLLKGTGIGSSVTALWKKRASTMPVVTTEADITMALQPLFHYFDQNFTIMNQTLTHATMQAVMTRLWKEVLMAIEHLLVPPLSDKPSPQRPLTQKELDIVYKWLQLLFEFFNAKDDTGKECGVPQDVLKSPKWHELAALNFFYFEDTQNLIRESERMAAANAQRAQQMLLEEKHENRLSAPATFGPTFSGGPGAFASMGTIRRGKSIMMSRNLGTMRRAKEEKRKEAQADPSDDMILRILRMRPEAANYLRERHRQKERQAAAAAAALIVKNSVNQGWNTGGGAYGRNNLPRR
ncbi:C2 domain containing protein [Colletotrichum musicola]|uniref:C2 domain containing protein n=1 Tax=Colletotrichum musicola TaxID=2175873 RepID=A0A8H6NXR1_9PEZI|nr:C2 domain containing protein [Colletotrichum musicola]